MALVAPHLAQALSPSSQAAETDSRHSAPAGVCRHREGACRAELADSLTLPLRASPEVPRPVGNVGPLRREGWACRDFEIVSLFKKQDNPRGAQGALTPTPTNGVAARGEGRWALFELFQILLGRPASQTPFSALSHNCAPNTRSLLRLCVSAWPPPSAVRSSQLLHFAAAKPDNNKRQPKKPGKAVSNHTTLFPLPLQPDTRAVQHHSGSTAKAARQASWPPLFLPSPGRRCGIFVLGQSKEMTTAETRAS